MTHVTSATLTLRSGTRIPLVGLGVWQTPTGAATRGAVTAALRDGYRHIDTARIYGNESDVGAALRASGVPREEVFITTKLWNQDHGYDRALRAFEQSLQRLGLDYLDLYLIHWPVAGLRLDTWRAFERLYEEKRVRAIGVSNYLVPHLSELLTHAKEPPHVNQIELSPFLQRRDTVEFCAKHGIILEAYSPLTRGLRLSHPTVTGIAARLQRSPAQVLLRWGIQKNFVVLPKSATPARIHENARLFDFTLDAAALRELDSLEEGLTTGWDPAQQA